MAAVPQNANSVSGTAVANLTTSAWSISGENRVLVAGMGWSAAAAPNYSRMNWGGSGGVLLAQVGATLAPTATTKLAMAVLAGPAAKSDTLYAELSGTADEFCAGGVSVTDANQATPLETPVTATGVAVASPATASAAVVARIDQTQLVIDMAYGDASTSTVAVGPGQLMQWEKEGVGGFGSGTQSTEPGSGAVTTSEVFSAAAAIDWGIIAVAINNAEVLGGGGSPPVYARRAPYAGDEAEEENFQAEHDVRSWFREALA